MIFKRMRSTSNVECASELSHFSGRTSPGERHSGVETSNILRGVRSFWVNHSPLHSAKLLGNAPLECIVGGLEWTGIRGSP